MIYLIARKTALLTTKVTSVRRLIHQDFEERFSLVETKRTSIEIVREATLNKIGRFTKQDIHELCPSLSISSIERALHKLVKTGELKREGVGKATCYFRTC